MIIGKQGLNPSIVICPYCQKPKNEIVLTGRNGELWAKRQGIEDGKMPMYVQIQGDIEPCEECKKIGIGFIEVDSTKNKTGRMWLIKREAVSLFMAESMLGEVLERGLCFIDVESAERLGLE